MTSQQVLDVAEVGTCSTASGTHRPEFELRFGHYLADLDDDGQ
jgi:hypothetical protein